MPFAFYPPAVATIADQPPASLNLVTLPDLWQQQAVAALRSGQDVVVHAPTGAGKTLIFELWSNGGKNRGQAIYTVPTRALANDKLAEWRGRGWNVGIATGDLAENLSAPILVATLETQKDRLVRGEGPALLVVDEYQMIGDADRGLNYELALALAPAHTQLLLLSGSVANPQDVVKWLRRLGRSAELIRSDVRPVPLEEVSANSLSYSLPSEIKGYWPRLVAKALAEDLGPILVFAPRRQGAEAMAAEIARNLPNPNPLTLTAEQKALTGEHLAKMLATRVAYHHSGLSYGVRAGVIEPLAKAGQLRVVVATMGLAAGINFSLRSVALAAATYRRDNVEQPLRPDEILQMFGRAGRRGLDETGFVIIAANELRLMDGRPGHLSRSHAVDWSALLGLMTLAARHGLDPFAEAVRVQERLFTTKPIFLGVEESLKHPDVPCGLKTDAERARHVNLMVREIQNSRGEWQRLPAPELRPVGTIHALAPSEAETVRAVHAPATPAGPPAPELGEPSADSTAIPQEFPSAPRTVPGPTLLPILGLPAAVDQVGLGQLCLIAETDGQKVYGRRFPVADLLNNDGIALAKWIRRLTNWKARQATRTEWEAEIAPLVAARLKDQKTPLVRYETEAHQILAVVSIAELPMRALVDAHGVALYKPPAREVMPDDCARCQLVATCRTLPAATGTAMLWRRLGLVDGAGVPTRRGQIVSCFSAGDGLAIAAALEDEKYPLDELIYDLANLEAGFRFSLDDTRWSGRLAFACHQCYGNQTVPGYLENGLPPKYGAGAEAVVSSVYQNPAAKAMWITDVLGAGDIDRIIIEWRSLLRQITHAPELAWPRWTDLQTRARTLLAETESPTMTGLPPLEYKQTKRVEHRLHLRRH